MNDQLQNALVDLIGKANSGIDSSVSFLSAELPDVVTQVLMWNGIQSALWFVFFFVCSVVSFRMAIKHKASNAINELDAAYKRGDEWTRFSRGSSLTSTRFDMEKEFARPKSYILYGITFTFCMITMSSITWLKILIAPKLYLIEYAATIVK